MAYLHLDHPITWEVTHHPVVTAIVVIVVAAAILSIFAGPSLGPSEIVGMEQVP